MKELINKIKKNLIFDKYLDPKRNYYNLNKYFNALYNYIKYLNEKNIKNKNIVLYANIKNLKEREIKEIIYSLAPLTHALHLLNNDLYVSLNYDIDNFDILKKLYNLYKERDKDLMKFINNAKKKIKSFDRLFKTPDYMITISNAIDKGFTLQDFNSNKVVLNLKFNTSWMKEYRKKELLKTSEVLLKQLYNIKKDYKGAEECFRVVVKLDPNNASAWYNLGLIFYNIKNL